jgi:ATP-dependent 26S proteasome regulatory subunit
MEEYDGVAILATNLYSNVDEAFARRLHHVIEFPFPDARYRERIWRQVFPAETPLDDDLDHSFLARQFELSGGNIRNVALSAAFMAAEADVAVNMKFIVLGVARELQKMGKLAARADFREYYEWVQTLE